jgi:N-hydroxyarylamine O-acetyltransferase
MRQFSIPSGLIGVGERQAVKGLLASGSYNCPRTKVAASFIVNLIPTDAEPQKKTWLMNTSDSTKLDLEAYLARIGYTGELRPTPEVLGALHLAHATHIPFENLDVLLGRPIRLDLASIQAKLVSGQRGGYCFEQNTLLAAVLEHLGFRVTRLAARVLFQATRALPRTHMLLRVDFQDESWLADVGFGRSGPLMPVPWSPGTMSPQFGWSYRLVQKDELWRLQTILQGSWQDLYAVSLDPQLPVDFEIANYYVSTHPDSRFVHKLAIQRVSPSIRHILRSDQYTVDRGGVEETRTLKQEELLPLLAEAFGLTLEPGTTLPIQREK